MRANPSVFAISDPNGLMTTYPFASADPVVLTTTYPFGCLDPLGLMATYPSGSAGGSGEANAPVFINPDPSGEANGSVGARPDPRFMPTGLGLRHFDPSASASTYVEAGRESVGRTGSPAISNGRREPTPFGFGWHRQDRKHSEPRSRWISTKSARSSVVAGRNGFLFRSGCWHWGPGL